MQLKLRHLILYVVACLILAIADVGGLSLLGVASLLQLAVLVQGFAFTKEAQLAELKLFLLGFPSLFFWGAMHSFVHIYTKESSLILAVMAASVSFTLSLYISFHFLFSQKFFEKNNFAVLPALAEAFNEVRNQKKGLFKTASLVFFFSFVPLLPVDWKLVFALTATLFVQNHSQLKKAFANL